MKKDVKVLALDFGASSGRAIIGSFDGEKISLKEIHRFTNDPVILLDTMYWDVLRLFHDIKIGLIKAKQEGEIKSLGIDTWGVDFGLLNKDGKLLENPVHYRDARTKGMMEKVFAKLDKDTVYSITGNQFMELNTLFQLMALKENQPELLQKAETLLLMPDLLNYFLSNEKCTEYTIASTTQLLDAKNKTWSSEIIENLDLPKNIFTKIVQPGTKFGKLSKQISEELGINEIDVIAVADPTSSPELLDPNDFSEFAQPALEDLSAEMETESILHICGNSRPILEEMLDCGFSGISVEEAVDMTEAQQVRAETGAETVMVGNVSTSQTLFSKPVEEVKAEVTQALEKGVNVLAPSCGIAPKSPLANLKAFVEARDEFYQ